MKFTHQQLLQAVREAGVGRETFGSADVRRHLGVLTGDKQQLSQFQHSFRNFRKSAADVIETLPGNRYRLSATAQLAAAAALAQAAQKRAEVSASENVESVHEASESVFASVAGLPDLTAELDDVTQRPAVRGWRERAQRLGRRVAQLIQGIGSGARSAA